MVYLVINILFWLCDRIGAVRTIDPANFSKHVKYFHHNDVNDANDSRHFVDLIQYVLSPVAMALLIRSTKCRLSLAMFGISEVRCFEKSASISAQINIGNVVFIRLAKYGLSEYG